MACITRTGTLPLRNMLNVDLHQHTLANYEGIPLIDRISLESLAINPYGNETDFWILPPRGLTPPGWDSSPTDTSYAQGLRMPSPCPIAHNAPTRPPIDRRGLSVDCGTVVSRFGIDRTTSLETDEVQSARDGQDMVTDSSSKCIPLNRDTHGMRPYKDNNHEQPHLPRKHSCITCETCFTRASDLKRHIRSHHDPAVPVLCCPVPDCSRMFVRKDKLNEHARCSHQPRHPADPEEHVCPTCSKKFDKEVKLVRHARYHVPESERRHKCLKCERRFTFCKDFKRMYTYFGTFRS